MIKMIDLKKQYTLYKRDVLKEIKDVCDSQVFIRGNKVINFEKNFAKFCNTKYAIGCSSGTDALILALRAYDIGCGDEVITTPFTFFATTEAIIRVGAIPVFVDIDEKTYCIDTKKLSKKINKKTKAIIPVHIFGQCANMSRIKKIAKEAGDIKVIEDSAQAHGSKWKNKIAGSMGDAGCFSFFPTKNLGAFGDAGIVTTNSKEAYKKMILLRQHGIDMQNKYDSVFLGGNFRLDAIQAAVLNVKLKYLDELTNRRIDNAKFLNDNIENDIITKPFTHKKASHVFHQYSIRSSKRDVIREKMRKAGIESAIFYPYPIHKQTCLSSIFNKVKMPICESVCKEIFSIPVHSELSRSDLKKIVEVINSIKV